MNYTLKGTSPKMGNNARNPGMKKPMTSAASPSLKSSGSMKMGMGNPGAKNGMKKVSNGYAKK